MGTNVLYFLVLCVAACLTAEVARMEQVPNPTLLPMFALFAQGIEAFHYFPKLDKAANVRANDPYAFVRAASNKVKAACTPRRPCVRKRKILCCVGDWLLAPLLVLATLFVCTVALIGILVQSASAYETETVQIIARLDVAATLVQGIGSAPTSLPCLWVAHFVARSLRLPLQRLADLHYHRRG